MAPHLTCKQLLTTAWEPSPSVSYRRGPEQDHLDRCGPCQRRQLEMTSQLIALELVLPVDSRTLPARADSTRVLRVLADALVELARTALRPDRPEQDHYGWGGREVCTFQDAIDFCILLLEDPRLTIVSSRGAHAVSKACGLLGLFAAHAQQGKYDAAQVAAERAWQAQETKWMPLAGWDLALAWACQQRYARAAAVLRECANKGYVSRSLYSARAVALTGWSRILPKHARLQEVFDSCGARR